MAIARKHDLKVIEDCAQAHGASWQGQGVGSIGDAGAFSFQASKNLTAGEGGIVVTKDEKVGDVAWSIHNVGRVKGGEWYEHPVMGSNYRMTEFQAAILLNQMKKLDAETQDAQRKRPVSRREALEDRRNRAAEARRARNIARLSSLHLSLHRRGRNRRAAGEVHAGAERRGSARSYRLSAAVSLGHVRAGSGLLPARLQVLRQDRSTTAS